MANQFNFNDLNTLINPETGETFPITVQTVKRTASNTPLAQAPIITPSDDIAPDCGQVTFTGAEWQALIDALDSYQAPLIDLVEVMPADNDIPFVAKTTHPITGDMVSRDDVVKELECLDYLQVRIIDETQGSTLDLLQNQSFNPADFDNDDKETAYTDIVILSIIANALTFATDTALNDIEILHASQQGAKDKATKAEIKRLKVKLTQLDRLTNILMGVIHGYCVWLCEQTGENPNNLDYISIHEAMPCLQDLWRDFTTSILADNDSDTAPAGVNVNGLTVSDIADIDNKLLRLRNDLSDSATVAICHLETIDSMLHALHSVIGYDKQGYKNSVITGMFNALEYVIQNNIADHQMTLDSLKQGA